jgi:putative transposase
MAATVLRNDVVLHKDGTSHRILHIELAEPVRGAAGVATGRVWLIRIDEPLALPYQEPFNKFNLDYKVQAPIQAVGSRESSDLFQPMTKAFERAPSAASLALGERAYERIAPLIDKPAILSPTTRHALLLERSRQPGSGTTKTLLKDLRNWWQGGQTVDALLGKYQFCGRTDGTGNRGRKRTAKGDLVGAGEAALRPYQLSQQDRDYMREVIETYYFNEKKHRTLADTLQELHRTRYTYIDGNGNECLRHGRECPSYRQLAYFLKQNYSLAIRLSRRKGEKRFAQEDRSTEGSIQLECHGAGHLYEFDATIVDVQLVSAKDRRNIVGKPTLYLIIDRYSRLIVGWYLGFENACYTAAMQALLSIGEDKEALCDRLDIPYDPADWPAHGVLPEMFLADQGELITKDARRIGRSLRCTISNVPGLRPDWKPLVECGFKMIHQIIAPDTPGYTPDAEARKRRSINVDKEASQNIHEFTIIIVAAIIAHNKTMQTNYPLSVGQVADGVRPVPRELFEHSVQRRMGSLDRMNFDKVREELLPRDKAVVTADGVEFRKMFFSCPEARARGWLVQGRKKRMPIEVAFDHRLVNEIILYSPNGRGESFVASLTKDSVKFQGMSLKEVQQHFADVEDLTADADEVKRQVRYEFNKLTQPVIDAAVRETRAATMGISRSSRRKDVAPARATELKHERAASVGLSNQRISTDAEALPSVSTATTAPSASKVISISRASQVEVLCGGAPAESTETKEPGALRPQTLAERMAEFRRRM